MNINELAKIILDNVGGETNVISLTHCVTRLRFNLKDEKKANSDYIKNLEGVLGVQVTGGQYQIIVGGKVNKLYHAIHDTTHLGSNVVAPKGNKSRLSIILEAISSILIPSLPPIIGGGMIKGFLFMFWEFGWITWGSDIFNLLNIISDGMFYFYPFLLAVSAAKRFNTNQYMALAIAGSMMHPAVYEAINAGVSSLQLFGSIAIPYLDYSSSVIPIILSVWMMSYIYRFFEKKIPDIVSVIFTPMLTLIILIPVSLLFICPLGYYIGEYLAKGVQALISFSPLVAGFVIGAIRPLTVFTGTHHAVRAIVSQQLASNGATTIGAMNYMSTMAQAAAPLAIYFILRNRNKKMKNLSLSAAVSGFLGVTEPGLYGIIMKYKVALFATMIGGGVGAAISAYFGGAEYAMVMSSIITIPATFGEGFIGIAIGLPASIIVTMLIIFMFRNKIIEEDEGIDIHEVEKQIKPVVSSTFNEKLLHVFAPVSGHIIPLCEFQDETFSKELIGKGIAIQPSNGSVVAPIDGSIVAIYPTKHAIGIKGNDGLEVLIHIGIDTVNLNGKYFENYVILNQEVKKGQKLVQFELDKIKAEQYCCDVIVIVTNTDNYLDVFASTKNQEVVIEEELLTIIG